MSKSESCTSRSGQPTNVPQRIFGSPKAKSQKRQYIEILVRGCECECVVSTSRMCIIFYVYSYLESFSPQVGWLVCVCLNIHSFLLLSWRENSAAAGLRTVRIRIVPKNYTSWGWWQRRCELLVNFYAGERIIPKRRRRKKMCDV